MPCSTWPQALRNGILRLARNQLLPELDFLLENSQDAGDPATALADKSRFEMEIGVMGSVPLPRK